MLEAIAAAFVAMGADAGENIVRLTALCGEVMRADAAVYFRIEGDSLFAVARWGLPGDFAPVVSVERGCLMDFRGAPDALHRRGEGAGETPLPAGGWCADSGFQACTARLVSAEGLELGLLCVLYKGDAAKVTAAEALMALVAGATAVEERRLRAEREKKKLGDALRQSMKMEAIGLLVGGIAHDFNNCLTTICGNAEMLVRREELMDEVRGEAEEIAKSGRYAASLTRQLLAFSRKQSVDPVVFDLNAVLADLAKMLRRTVGERVELVLDPAAGPAKVRADVGQIEQVVMNLAVNARDAMPDGGRLTIRVLSVEDGPKPESRRGPFVMMEVSDTGAGIEPAVMDRLFEPFFTTKDPGKGTGLGLATVQGIVLQNGGAVAADSEAGRGARFRVWLPAVTDAATAGSAAVTPETFPLAAKRVLFVEDEAPVRSLVSRILRNAGMVVIEASSGDAALALERGERRADIVVTDIVMPGISGYELARRLREEDPGLPVVFVSGYADEETLNAAATTPNACVLMKPFTPSELVRRVRRTLADAARPRG